MSHDALVELREESAGRLVLRGYPSVSERWYKVGGLFEEKVNRGTWRRCLGEGPDTVLLEDHSGLGLARTRTPSGEPTLLLSEDSNGLFAEAFLDATAPRVQDLRSTAENCGLQMSIGFRCTVDRWSQDRSRRELKEATLHRGDVTVCNFGANEAATATITARAQAGEAERRAYAENVRGSLERRVCPVDLETESRSSTLLLLPRSSVMRAKANRSRLRGGERRSGYAAHELAELGAKGMAYLNADGHWSHPTKTRDDWEKARLAVGRSGGSHNGVRKYLIGRAQAMGLSHLVPSNWAPSGALR